MANIQSKINLIAKNVAASVAVFSLVFFSQDSKAFVPLVVAPIVVGIETWAATSTGAAALAALQTGTVALAGSYFTKELAKTSAAGTIANLLGKAVNSVNAYLNGSTSPKLEVQVDPNSFSSSTPPGWVTDSNTGISYSPLSYSGVFDAQSAGAAQCHEWYDGASGPQDITTSISSDGKRILCLYRGGVINQFELSSFSPPVSPGALPLATPSGAPKWPSDGHCTVVRNGNSFSGHPQDPDCGAAGAASPAMPDGFNISPSGSAITGNNGNGSSTTITINPDGSITVQTRTPSGTVTNETTMVLSPPIAGQVGSVTVVGQGTKTYEGTGTVTGATPIPVTVPVTGTGAGAATGTGAATDPAAPADASDLCTKHPGIDACATTVPGSPSRTDGLYTKQTGVPQTFGEAFSLLATKITSSQLWTSMTSFVSIGSIGGGSCSGLDTTVQLFATSIPVSLSSFFCSSMAETIYSLLYVGVILGFTWAAFAIAIL